ncbi:chemotaxis-specific protein-glutamate methyltransferase CheB [Candidatus Solirubrobacter pratensis]|uniref:chemotaxis-specific protein-glutamate methyltransferase CheB n=1 Tax=Candidatus Solirubrobacter pratensis TaxID=1298857 RepID=UPI000414A2D3|nr:chemotaxis-specific protein-glutamate methyltransferase CheB [Candidatus Solirubrobacter pratensis]
MAATTPRQRIVVADDSRLMRRILSDALGRQGFDVVATAADGDQALEACRAHRPDALTLDLAMPGMDGIGVLRALREGKAEALPVVVVSAFSPAHGARAVDALAEGAFDLVAKPALGESMDSFTHELARKVGAATESGRARRRASLRRAVRPHVSTPVPPRAAAAPGRLRAGARKLVLIASSTGGPKALGELIPKLPSPLGIGALIVQHMPAGFTASLAARLDSASRLKVAEATGGEALDPRHLLLAPGGAHLRLGDDKRVRLSDAAPMGGLRPRADLTILDAARIYGPSLLLVVLTGMGKDGLDGAKAVKAAGGRVLVEAESTCVVYGMPRAVAEAGLADEVLPLDELPAAIAREAAA